MSGLDLKSLLHLTPKETADLFRREIDWVYKHSGPGGLLEKAVRRYGPRNTLYLKAELERIIASPPPPKTRVCKKTQKRYTGNIPDGPGTEDPEEEGGTHAEA